MSACICIKDELYAKGPSTRRELILKPQSLFNDSNTALVWKASAFDALLTNCEYFVLGENPQITL